MERDAFRELGNLSRTVYGWNMALVELRADSAKERLKLLEHIVKLRERVADLERQVDELQCPTNPMEE